MNTWIEKDGWNYSQDGLTRWQKRKDGSVNQESVPQGDTLTQQQFIEDCDVNVILKRIAKTGEMPLNANLIAGDFTQLPSYEEALATVIQAEKSFLEFPAELRQRFSNNPQILMDFLADEKNSDEAIKLGLRNPAAVPPAPNPILTELQSLNKNLNKKPKTTDIE
nr:MAG: internal scaffolding protein [Microvirus sp.]QJB19700.1 MAG: internal scaffolding protein [Microvirus sp.]